MHLRRIVALWVVLGTVFAASTASAQTSMPAYPESEAGLRQLFREILDASAAKDANRMIAQMQALNLPDPDKWFTQVFGDKIGPKLAADYKKEHSKEFTGKLAGLFLSPIAAMQEPTPLYTVSVTKAGTNAHITLWSFVYVDGRFHLAGKMRGIKDADDPKPGE
jgi:hypothetical protein